MYLLTENDLCLIIRKKINEAISNIKKESFNNWKTIFDSYLNEVLNEINDRYLNKLGLGVQIDKGYNFGKRRWLASYEASSNKLSQGIILIAINYPHIYDEMCKRSIDKDNFNIEAQAKITIGHEIGHGIVDYLVNYYDGENEAIGNFILDYYNGVIDEEEIVEEFGESMFPDATQRWSSYLGDLLTDI